MRTPLWSRIILSALLVSLAVPGAFGKPEEEETPKAKVQKKRQVPRAAAPTQTQTAPAAGKEKGEVQTAPARAGIRAITGMVTRLFPERHSLTVRTTTNEYKIFITPQTVLLRDGQPVGFDGIKPGDRIDSCQFNAKNVVLKMSITSREKATGTPPPPPPPPQ